MAKFTLLYNDVRDLADLEDVTSEKLDEILDDILELQAKMDELSDKYMDLLDACKMAISVLDGEV